jgi:hypothetical protein
MTRILTALLSLLLAAAPSVCAVHVPDDISEIGDALLAASPYDTILVAPGTYYVNLEWPSTPGIKLIGSAGALETVLDGQDKVQVIGIYTGVDTTTVIRGFRIQNGHAEGQ